MFIRISCKASGLPLVNAHALEELNQSLKDTYMLHLKTPPGAQAGGVLDVVVELFIEYNLDDVAKEIGQILFEDALLRGKNSIALKPLFTAFSKIEATKGSWDYSHVSFFFEDTDIVIFGGSNLFTSKVPIVMNTLLKQYDKLVDEELGKPSDIIIPISKEINEDGEVMFSNYGGGGDFPKKDYAMYWGLEYFGGERKIFDVRKEKVIEKTWRY